MRFKNRVARATSAAVALVALVTPAAMGAPSRQAAETEVARPPAVATPTVRAPQVLRLSGDGPSNHGGDELGVSSRGDAAAGMFSVIGEDNRRKVSDTTAVPYSGIVVFFDNEDKPRCSGSMVGPDTVLTAAHCIVEGGKILTGYTFCPGAYYSPETWSVDKGGGSTDPWIGSSSVDKSNPVPSGDPHLERSGGSTKPDRSMYKTPFGCIDATAIWWDHQYLNGPDREEHDFALIHLSEKLSKSASYFGFSKESPEGMEMTITGYPGDHGLKHQWTPSSRYVRATGISVFYDIDTAGGQSGSPVYGRDRKVYAVHAYAAGSKGPYWDLNSGTRITPEYYDLVMHYARSGGWEF